MTKETNSLAEYTALKTEQTYRIQTRDNSMITVFLVVGGLSILSLSSDSNTKFLLLIPFISFSCFWVYISNDFYISKIRNYLKDNPANKGWESFHKADNLNCLRKSYTFVAKFIGFLLPSIYSIYFNKGMFYSISFELAVILIASILCIVNLILIFLTIDY